MAFFDSVQVLVAILDGETFEQLFVAAQPMRVSVRKTKRVTRYEVEDGTVRSDHTVDDQIEIAIDILVEEQDARDTYLQFSQAMAANRLVTVQTKVSSYDSMLISEMPHDETIELGGAISIPLRLVEWRTVSPQYGGSVGANGGGSSLPPSKVKNKKQASTSKGGQKQTTEADAPTKRKASVLYGVFN